MSGEVDVAGLESAVENAKRVFGWQHLAKYSHHTDEWLDRTLRAVVLAATDDLRERVRVVEGERDLYLRHIDIGTEQLTETTHRAESAEAAHAALRAGVEALIGRVSRDAAIERSRMVRVTELRALLATEARA